MEAGIVGRCVCMEQGRVIGSDPWRGSARAVLKVGVGVDDVRSLLLSRVCGPSWKG